MRTLRTTQWNFPAVLFPLVSGKSTGVAHTLMMALFYWSVPVSHERTVRHCAQYQDCEAAKGDSAIFNRVIYTCSFPTVTSTCLTGRKPCPVISEPCNRRVNTKINTFSIFFNITEQWWTLTTSAPGCVHRSLVSSETSVVLCTMLCICIVFHDDTITFLISLCTCACVLLMGNGLF